MMLIADQVTPAGTTISWEYELNGTGIVQNYEPFAFRRLSQRSSHRQAPGAAVLDEPLLDSPVITMPGDVPDGQSERGVRRSTSGSLTEFEYPFRYVQVYTLMSLPLGTQA